MANGIPEGFEIESAPQRALDDEDRDLVIRTIYGEAANEPEEGQAAVAAVIRNRTETGRWGGRPRDVVLAKNQFEPWNGGEARRRMEALRQDDPRYQRIGQLVDEVFTDTRPDPTGGATHFFAPVAQSALGRNRPSWAREELTRIGGHAFFAPEGRVERSPIPQGFEIASNEQPQAGTAAPPTGIPEGFEIEAPVAATPAVEAPQPTVETPPAANPTEGPGAISRGFVSGLLEQNPTTAAEAMEGFSILSGETPEARPIGSIGDILRDAAKLSPEEYKMRTKSIWESKDFGEVGSRLGELFGSGVASTLPGIGLGLTGGAVGSRLGGRAGMIGGATVGATAPSFVLNYGEVYKALKDEKVDPKRAAEVAFQAAPFMAALDAASIGPVISRLGGLGTAKQAVARHIAKRFAGEAAKGAGREGLTETVQEAIKLGTVSLETDKPFWTMETAKALGEAGIGGAIVGGPIGAVSGLAPDKTVAQPADPEAMAKAARELAERPTLTPQEFASRREDSAPIWYSPLRKAVETRGPNSATPEQWAATLRNAPGIKDEEIKYTGLDTYWQNTRGPVTKQEVLDYLDDNAVAVRERVYTTDVNEAVQAAARGRRDVTPDVKYHEYVAPGGQNYRELLLTLPNAATRQMETVEGLQLSRSNELYTSEHWSTPNVLAHVRFTDRTDASGVPVVHVEEIQSDWHQSGRERGYRGSSTRMDVQEALASGIVKDYHTPSVQADSNRSRWRYTVGVQGRAPMATRFYDTQMEALREAQELLDAANQVNEEQKVPDAPFKTSWPELAIKRMIRWAADNGVQRLTFTNGQMAAKFAAGGVTDPKKVRGLEEFYDTILPSLLKKWAKRLGGTIGMTQLYSVEDTLPLYDIIDPSGRVVDAGSSGGNSEAWARQFVQGMEDRGRTGYTIRERKDDATVFYLDIPPTAMSVVRKGMPLFSRSEKVGRVSKDKYVKAFEGQEGYPVESAANKIVEVLQASVKEFDIRAPVHIALSYNPTDMNLGSLTPNLDGSYTIKLNTFQHRSADELYVTAMHEFGHLVMFEKFARASTRVQQAIKNEYQKFREGLAANTPQQELWLRRDNAVVNYYALRGEGKLPIYALTPDARKYWASFDEWFAEQVARWATSSEVAIGFTDKIFKGLGDTLRRVLDKASRLFGLSFHAPTAVAQWLDSFHTGAPPFGTEVISNLDQRTKEWNRAALDGEGTAVERQEGTDNILVALNSALGELPPEVRKSAAHADRMNKFHKWMTGLDQLVDLNPLFTPLQRYAERVREMHLDMSKIFDAAMRTLKGWRDLGPQQGDALGSVLDEIANMRYRTDEEVRRGVARNPTENEAVEIFRKHKLSNEGISVFQQIRHQFDTFLKLVERNAIEEAARKITDPLKLQQRIVEIRSQTDQLLNRPYFPFMRFGRHFILVTDKAGAPVHFETVERRGVRNAERMQKLKETELRKAYPDANIEIGVLPEGTQPFIGMPPALLDSIASDLELTEEQMVTIRKLRNVGGAQSYTHRYRHNDFVKGYSMDFKRAFAQYFFYGGRYYSRVKYAWELRGLILAARSIGGNTAGYIADYMQDHLQNTILDSKGDIGWLKSGIFLWALGYVPAAATLNLSQTPMITLPYLAAKFGDVAASKALVKAMSNITSFYKRGSYENMSDFEMRALDYGIKTGRITETQAGELAAATQGNNLLAGFGGTRLQQNWQRFMQGSAWMFEMAEQFNRRVAYRATLDLAQQKPNAKTVNEAVAKYRDEFEELQRNGFTESEARAVVTANHAVDQTQFVYARYARPRFMRGRISGTIFVFKKYMQSVLMLLGMNKSDVLPRYLIVAAAAGGLMGIPGMDDLDDILRAVGHWMFGKDFNLKIEVREYIMNHFNGKIPPDLVLHGLARKGFGLPALVDMMGENPSRGLQPGPAQNIPFPVFDRSRAVSMGNIIPVEIGKLIGPPSREQDRVVAEQIQRASGAAFGVGFNIYKAIRDTKNDISDFKRWEKAVPRQLANVSRSWRAFSEGRERTRGGVHSASSVIKYDWRDPEQMGEIIGLATGYQPMRLNAKWDLIMAKREAEEYVNQQRTQLLGQAFEAKKSGAKDDIERVRNAIKEFNSKLPPQARAKAITDDTLQRSMAARERERQARETGVPVHKTSRGITRHMETLFPEATEIRKVK